MAPLTDWELWACAQQVIKTHGGRAPAFVAERIGALALAGDSAGVEAWKAIAARIEQLGDYSRTSSSDVIESAVKIHDVNSF